MTASVKPCPATRERWNVRLSFDRSTTAQRSVRAWSRRLTIIDSSKEHNPWLRYLHSVYGDALRLPFDLRTLRWFWWWAPGTRNLTRLEMPVWRILRPGDIWLPGMRIERHLSLAGFFVQAHEIQYSRGYPDGSLVEIMRVSHPPGENPSTAYGPEAASTSQVWYWHAPGSGIYLTVGRSLVVTNRSALLEELSRRAGGAALPLFLKRVEVPRELGLRLCDGCTPEPWLGFDVVWARKTRSDGRRGTAEGMVLCDPVRAAGFDTVQLVAAFGGQRFEIIDCRVGIRLVHRTDPQQSKSLLHREHAIAAPPAASWTSACTPPATSAQLLRPGAGGSWQACNCSRSIAFLNCGLCATPTAVQRVPHPGHDAFIVHPPSD